MMSEEEKIIIFLVENGQPIKNLQNFWRWNGKLLVVRDDIVFRESRETATL